MKKVYWIIGGCISALVIIGALVISSLIGKKHYRLGVEAEKSNNITEAISQYSAAMKHKNADAAYCLGLLLASDIESDSLSMNNAFLAFERSLKYGKKEAAFNVADCYLNGRGVETDSLRAIKYLQLDAAANTMLSKDLLGILYISQETNADTLEAVKLFKEAANLGNAKSARRLGIYYNSIGALELSAKWYQKGADMGDAKAQHTLGKALINGELGLKVDQQNGFEYLLSAVNQEFVPAYADVGYCYSQGVGTKVDYSEAFNYFTQGAALNDPCAIYNLAVCYDNGWGTAKNHNTAIEYYKKSASAGFQPAIDYLNSLSQHQKQIRQEQERRKKQELVTCPVCHGTGRVVGTGMWHGDILTCSTCFGAGMITREEFDRWRRYGF